MAKLRTSRTFDVIFVTILLVGLGLAALNRIAVGDWVFGLTHHPTEQTIQVADDAGLSPLGQRLLERTNPLFVDAATVATDCDTEELGCLTEHGQAIILNAPHQYDQAVVTAAHEMLHLAYRRLSQAQKDELASSLDQAISQNLIGGLRDELANEESMSDRRDEAHSLLGTEYANLPTTLEQHYAAYFSDRTKVVAAYKRSQQ